jgi:hypothetical protein
LFVVEPPLVYIYLPVSQNLLTGMTLLLETAGPPGALAAPLQAIVGSLDPAARFRRAHDGRILRPKGRERRSTSWSI